MFQMVLNHEATYFTRAPSRLLRAAAQYTRFATHSGMGLRSQWQNLTRTPARLLWLTALPLAATLLLRDRLRQSSLPRAAALSVPTLSNA